MIYRPSGPSGRRPGFQRFQRSIPTLLQRGRHEEPASSPATLQANNLGGRSLFCPGRRGAPGGRASSTTATVSFGNGEFGSIPVSASSGCRVAPASAPKKAPAKAAALPAAAAKFMGSPSLQLHVRHGGAALHASAVGVEEMPASCGQLRL